MKETEEADHGNTTEETETGIEIETETGTGGQGDDIHQASQDLNHNFIINISFH